jgi:hypothetical protein
MVLLNVAWMCATPLGTFFFSFFLRTIRLLGIYLSLSRLPLLGTDPVWLSPLRFRGKSSVYEDLSRNFAEFGLFSPTYLRLCRALTGPGVGMSALTTDRKTPAMSQASIASEIHQSLDVHTNFSAKVSLHLILAIKDLTDLGYFHLSQPIRIHARVETDFLHDFTGSISSYPVNIGQGNFHTFVLGKVNPCNTGQVLPPRERPNYGSS